MRNNVNRKHYIISDVNGSTKTIFSLNFAQLKNLNFINTDEIAKSYDLNNIQKY